MKKSISKNHVNEKIVRIVAGQVVLITILLLLTEWRILAYFLIIDFALRAFTTIPSLLALNAKGISRTFNLTPKPIFAPPKKFAAAIGFLFTVTIAVLLYMGLITGAYVVGGILIFCAALEAFLNICIGCYVFNWLVAPFIKTRGV
ncbi:MAG TPA: DUF4395 domain-containing protein [Fermentimonas caenicola]|jgi:hypothetical protein|uniref:Putative membrane protein n=1 Tax=Fermentimonas caenicola TaxID=1562970 RepID=A0A098BYL2_9BACT|nr:MULTISPECIES: DUF4395 domain-containing protein [Lascolabacillus]MBP6174815.1 DUF4395 domain-containing protein [Fermentimonas sp.]MDI9625262.1 DUF4395 domain-containing protein [Bacteroidota bacterium]TAH61171.1 MAG: DUF4395 domain-containing protein [Fermentimonas caenicola]MBP6197204.1 DUF4395 domain-containing protein [Fermentimonas sp.]MBP7104782.1 DUF4395 domain-containing protein [Fermentimonas sp.]